MDIPAAIALNTSALVRIIARLFAMLGLPGDAAPVSIPLNIHRRIARVLRPAESAVRRLIVVLARISGVTPPPFRPAPAGFCWSGERKPRVTFALFDPRQRFFRKRRDRNAPRPQPRISFFLDGEVRTISLAPEAPPPRDDMDLDPSHLLRRLEALKAALEDLPRQARRLVRAMARRERSKRRGPKMPLRPGTAPGYRRKPVLEIDSVLHECAWLAREAMADTS